MNLKYIYLTIFFCALCFTYSTNAQQNSGTSYKTHTVNKGETAYSIATSYGISVDELYSLNPRAEKGVQINEVLIIPQNKGQDYILHSIQYKETLYSVSKHYDIAIEDILAINPGLSTENFRIGNVVRIPQHSSSAKPSTSGSQTITSEKREKHIVQAKETLTGIANQHQVTIDQLAELNPEVRTSGLKKGMVLLIPTVYSTPIQQTASTSYSEIKKEKSNVIKVGLLLPFLDKQDSQRDRFIEYYEGFLLAVQDIKSKGYSAEIYTFDIGKGKDTKKLKSLLDTYEMKSLDLIIGGVSDEEISIISQFTKNNNIKYAIPFPIKAESNFLKNADAFQVNIPLSELYPKAAGIFTSRFKNYNVIIVSDEAKNNDKSEFISILKTDMNKSGISHQTIQASAQLESLLKTALSSDRKNIIIPTSSSLTSLGKIISALKNIETASSNLEISLFGYPEWQAYYAQFLQDFFSYDTYIYSSFYVDNNDNDTQNLMNRYRNWYNKTLINTYPKYGLLGYDTGLYFMSALSKYGTDFQKHLPLIKAPTLQSTFYFEKKADNKGYINTGIFFIHYSPDMTIDKIDYSK